MTALEVDLNEPEVLIRDMLTINRAIDLYAGDLSRRGCSERTRYTYTRILGLFADRLPEALDVSKITSDDCRRFLDLYNRRAAGTKVHTYTVLSSFFKWLVTTEQTKRSPMTPIPRPRRQRSEDLDVTTVTGDDVRRLLAAGEGWTERLAVAVAVYLGPRRHALSQLRLHGDYNRATGKLRFREKGSKTIWKPVPDELANLIEAAIDAGVYKASLAFLADSDQSGDPYLIPPEAKLQKVDRDDRVIWRVVKRVADRAGVETHVHALRAAFAVGYLEQNPGDTYGAQQLLGHANPQQTQVYLRMLDKDTVMERVRSLSWEPQPDAVVDEVAAMREKIADLQSRLATAEAAHATLEASGVMGAGGFEPPQADSPVVDRGCGTDLVVVLDGEARSVADQATREAVTTDG
jgi:integrase